VFLNNKGVTNESIFVASGMDLNGIMDSVPKTCNSWHGFTSVADWSDFSAHLSGGDS
jgi:hypothetical protein